MGNCSCVCNDTSAHSVVEHGPSISQRHVCSSVLLVCRKKQSGQGMEHEPYAPCRHLVTPGAKVACLKARLSSRHGPRSRTRAWTRTFASRGNIWTDQALRWNPLELVPADLVKHELSCGSSCAVIRGRLFQALRPQVGILCILAAFG